MSGRDGDALSRQERSDALLELRIWWPHPSLPRWVERWRTRIRDRHTLAGLDDRALRELGLERADLDIESTQSFWRWR